MCYQFNKEMNSNKRRTSNSQYLLKLNNIYGQQTFQYLEFNPIGCLSSVNVRCKKCNFIFKKGIQSLIKGKVKCQSCSSNKVYTKQRFMFNAQKKHGKDRYSYQRIKQIKCSKTMLPILCNVCNRQFMQSLNSHLHKNRQYGCPFCQKKSMVYSKGHLQVVDFIKTFYDGPIKLNDRKTIKNIRWMQLDIYLPQLNFAVEYSGTYWHSDPQRSKYDIIKDIKCKQKDIFLFRIKDKQEWKIDDKREQIEKRLKSIILRKMK